MKKSLLLLPLALLVMALALAACGGGGSSSSSSGGGGSEDEAAIEEAITKSATTTETSKCTEFQTQSFNEQEHAVSGKEATEVCEEATENETPAKSVTISEIKVEGETATADVEVDGTALNGQGLELELVSEEGQWKLNEFLGFANYDGQALAESLEEEFENEEGVSAALGKCVSEGVAKFSQAQAEEVAFEGKTEGLEKLGKTCRASE